MRPSLLILSAILAVGCSRGIDVDDTNGDDTSDTEDTEDTSDTEDTEDSGDTDSGDPNVLDCSATYSTPAPIGGDGDDACITESIACGDEFFATSEGGSDIADVVYEQPSSGGFWACNPGAVGPGGDWSASERFYELEIPPNTNVTLRLDAKCGEIYVRAVRSDTPCDVIHEHNCWLPSVSGDNQTLQLVNPNDNNSARYDVVIDGVDGFEGNFGLEVDCN